MILSDKISKALIYKFFSECFYFPDENQLSVINSFKGKLPKFCEKIIDKANNPQQLQIDYSRLFVGPFEVLSPPYGSVYLEEGKKTYGDSTIDIIQLYQEEKLNVMMKEPPDHIAIELEFMYYLQTKECDALNKNDLGKSTKYRKKQEQFIKRHLSVWVEEFADSIFNNAESEFYKLLATELKLWIKTDLINFDLN